MKYSYAAVSDVGKREINEDALEVRAGRCYLACALGDGLGGQGSGDFASKLATDVSIRRMSGFLPAGRRTLDACVREANRLIRDQQEEQHCRMMTTLALLRLSGARAQLAYVGDTRIYWIRGGEIIYQSKDHSIPQMMVTCGEITYDQIRGHESRNLLTRAWLQGRRDGGAFRGQNPARRPSAAVHRRLLGMGAGGGHGGVRAGAKPRRNG